jgi:DNA-binding MarR family transcriptional regulator
LSSNLRTQPPPSLDDTPALRAWRDQTLYRLVLRATRAESTATLDRLRDRGYSDISIADANLLANLDTQGVTLSALARRVGVTRQAIGQQVSQLEQAGYVDRRPSEADGRAVVVIQTARGRALLQDALDIVSNLEKEYAFHLGADRLSELKSALTDLLSTTDPTGWLGRD